MAFSTSECAWSHTEIKVFGRIIKGLRGWEFEKNFDKEYLHAAGNEPIDIQPGMKTYPGSLKLLKFEVDLINDACNAAGYEDYTEVPHEAIVITCAMKKRPTDKIRTVTATGIAFTNMKFGMDQGAKMTEVSLPYIAMKTTIRA